MKTKNYIYLPISRFFYDSSITHEDDHFAQKNKKTALKLDKKVKK
jgi:hypothetical protein